MQGLLHLWLCKGPHIEKMCRCPAPTLRYLPTELPAVSLFGGNSSASQRILVANGYGDASWGGYGSSGAIRMQALSCSTGTGAKAPLGQPVHQQLVCQPAHPGGQRLRGRLVGWLWQLRYAYNAACIWQLW